MEETTMRLRWLLIGTLLLACAGCGRPFGRVERRIEARLPEVVGPADEYEVQISRSVASTLNGKVRWLEVHGRNVEPAPGMRLERVELRLEGLRLDQNFRQIRAIRRAEVEFDVSEESLNASLDQRSPDLREVDVDFVPRHIRIRVPGPLVDAEGPVEFEGEPVLTTPTTIDWKFSRLVVADYSVRSDVLRKLTEAFNPVVDLSRLKFPVQLTRVQVGERLLTVGGAASLTAEQLQELSGGEEKEGEPNGTPPAGSGGRPEEP
jgi:hypothetical protein